MLSFVQLRFAEEEYQSLMTPMKVEIVDQVQTIEVHFAVVLVGQDRTTEAHFAMVGHFAEADCFVQSWQLASLQSLTRMPMIYSIVARYSIVRLIDLIEVDAVEKQIHFVSILVLQLFLSILLVFLLVAHQFASHMHAIPTSNNRDLRLIRHQETIPSLWISNQYICSLLVPNNQWPQLN
jgi:hypothetical protein